MRFPSCLQNQALENLFLILVARPWAPQAVFQQPASPDVKRKIQTYPIPQRKTMKNNAIKYAVALCAVITLLIAACSKQDEQMPLMVYAAAGTAPAMKEIGAAFTAQTGIPIVFNFANAGFLARQICQEDKAHVFFSANEKWMDYVEQAGRIEPESRQILLQDVMVVVVPKGKTLAVDLTKPRLEQSFDGWFVIGDQTTPLGIYAKQALTKLGWWETLKPHRVEATTVTAVLNYVVLDEVDAGIVFRSVASCSADKVDIIAEMPEELHKPIRFPVAICKNHHPDSKRFLNFLKSDVAQKVFSQYGWTLYEDN